MSIPHKICIIGVGLLGGSLGLKLKEVYPKMHITGLDTSKNTLNTAKNKGCIDSVSDDISIVSNVDIIIIATPVKTIKEVARLLQPYITNQLIFDVGSTKQHIIKDVESMLGIYPRFIPCHPIAGKEFSGNDMAEANLFENKKVIICREAYHKDEDIDNVVEIWQACGSIVEEMDAKTHDIIFSLTSHVPHLVVFGYINMMATSNKKSYDYTGGGLKDFVRIAASDPKMWADITLANQHNISENLQTFIEELAVIKVMVDNSEYDNLLSYFKTSNISHNNIR